METEVRTVGIAPQENILREVAKQAAIRAPLGHTSGVDILTARPVAQEHIQAARAKVTPWVVLPVPSGRLRQGTGHRTAHPARPEVTLAR